MIIIAGLFSSCREYCLTPLVGGAAIVGDTAAVAADTQIILVSYKKDGKFSTPLTTTYFKPDTVNEMHHNRYSVGFPYPANNSADDPALDFDWIITLQPSGRIYKLRDVNSQNRHIRKSGGIKKKAVSIRSLTLPMTRSMLCLQKL